MKKTFVKGITALTLAASLFSGTVFSQRISACGIYNVGSYQNTEAYTVYGTTYYLALRTETAYRAENEIGKIVNGQIVEVVDRCTGNSDYWYVYAPTLGKYGYVNCNYLKKESCSVMGSSTGYYTVKGVDIYLALRTETAYRAGNEIGKIYNGETVEVVNTNTGDSDYWYIYAPTLGKYGYVNRNYLV